MLKIRFIINNRGAEKPHVMMTVQDDQILLWSCQAWSQTPKCILSRRKIENIPFVFKKSMNFNFENSTTNNTYNLRTCANQPVHDSDFVRQEKEGAKGIVSNTHDENVVNHIAE